jgi:hypothetical protein
VVPEETSVELMQLEGKANQQELQPMNRVNAYSAVHATSLPPSTGIKRRDPTERDVQLEILFCGI